MNKLIRDLALESIVENISAPAWVFTDDELLKFAMLIIQECAAICTRVGVLELEEAHGEMYARAVKESFGVKE